MLVEILVDNLEDLIWVWGAPLLLLRYLASFQFIFVFEYGAVFKSVLAFVLGGISFILSSSGVLVSLYYLINNSRWKIM